MPDQRMPNGMNRLTRDSLPGSGGAWKLFYFMLFVFFVFILTYVGLVFGYKNFLKARIQTTSQEIESLVATDPIHGKQDEFLTFQSQLISLKSLLDKRGSSLKVLKLLENRTTPKIYYTNLSFSLSERRVELQGNAPSYETFAEQLAAYAQMKEVERYEVGTARVKEAGRVNFTVVLYFTAQALAI